MNVSILKSKSRSIYTFRVDIFLLDVISVFKRQANSGMQSIQVCITVLYTFCCMLFRLLNVSGSLLCSRLEVCLKVTCLNVFVLIFLAEITYPPSESMFLLNRVVPFLDHISTFRVNISKRDCYFST